MKKICTLLSAILFTLSGFAQAPEKISYQAIVKNSSGEFLTNQAIGMKISILAGGNLANPGPTIAYAETHLKTTNANGLVSLEIGTGAVITGVFATIDWANSSYFIKTETDPNGASNYTTVGVSQLLSVPYALHAKTVETITEGDPVFTTWDKSSGITITESQISDLAHTVDNHWTITGNDLHNANSGNVGIGTATPGSKLVVETHASAWASFIQNQWYGGGGHGLLVQGAFPSFDATVFQAQVGATPILTINGDQKVGIGTITPAEKLHIKNGTIRIDDGANPYTLPTADGTNGQVLSTNGTGNVSWAPAGTPDLFTSSNSSTISSQGTYVQWNKSLSGGETNFINNKGAGVGGFNFRESGETPTMVLTGDGKLGIGTATPQYKLDVADGFFHSTYNTTTLPANDANGGLAVGWNRSDSGGEVNFYNVFNGASTSFQFSQKTGAATANDLMTIKGNGNVGIGTAAPSSLLHLKAATPIVTLENSSANGTSGIDIGVGTGNRISYLDLIGDDVNSDYGLRISRSGHRSFISHNGTNELFIQTKNSAPIVLTTNSIERLRITNAGNIGIGTPTPDAKLQVVGGNIKVDANQNISIGDLNFHSVKDSHNYIDFNQSLFFRNTAAVNHMVIDPNGMVGIGTPTPDAKLQVVGGDIKVDANQNISIGDLNFHR
ncbi:MAG: hypothetical protein ACKVJP_11465 [Flavobacteriales bacterium]